MHVDIEIIYTPKTYISPNHHAATDCNMSEQRWTEPAHPLWKVDPSITITFLFFGLLFTSVGFSDLADKFCISNIDTHNPDSLLGPEGHIVNFLKVYGISFMAMAVASVFANPIANLKLRLSPNTNLSKSDSGGVRAGLQIYLWYARLAIVFLWVGVGSIFAMAWTISDNVPEWCRNADAWEYKMPYLALHLYALFSLAGFAAVFLLVCFALAFVSRDAN